MNINLHSSRSHKENGLKSLDLLAIVTSTHMEVKISFHVPDYIMKFGSTWVAKYSLCMALTLMIRDYLALIAVLRK